MNRTGDLESEWQVNKPGLIVGMKSTIGELCRVSNGLRGMLRQKCGSGPRKEVDDYQSLTLTNYLLKLTTG